MGAGAGAKGFVTEWEGVESWSPVWNDPVYLEKLDAFLEAFARRYDAQPWVRYVDVASIGEWGEGHTSNSTKIPPTVAEVKDNLKVYLKHFKKTMLVVTDDLLYYGKPDREVEELYRYAVSNGFAVRDNSPMVSWYLDRYAGTGSVSHPRFYDPLYKTKPVILPVAASFPSVMQAGLNSLEVGWLNKGVAPAYHTYALAVRLESEKTGKSIEIVLPDSRNKKWLPGEESFENYSFDLPPSLPRGTYRLGLKLFYEGAEGGRAVDVGVSEATIRDGFVRLGEVEFK